ncbi:MAG: PBP1A family penicillin-binding protein [Acidimicrobiales bacterium]|nr:PBP1A family penicillin-binding protein [Acidimicrobiales bacterium]
MNAAAATRSRVVAAVAALSMLAAGCAYTTPELHASIPPNSEASTILAANGTELTTLHAGENRTEITLDEVPEHVQNAIVAAEDRRFWTHIGIDVRGILRALRRNVDEGAVVEGGSTITQQFVKNAIIGSDRTLDRKIEEASLAIQVERQFTKEEILESYLNTIYFGAGAYGIEAAAQIYFGIPAADLDIAQGALLAGLIKAPSTYDPFVNAEGAIERRTFVLDAMADEGYISADEAEQLAQTDIVLATPDPESTYDGAYFVEEVKRFILEHPAFGRTYEERARLLFTGGLTIETTLDLRLQALAEASMERVLVDPFDDPDGALVAMDPATGQVKAMVGGRDFFDGGPQSKFNLATQGQRPSGSSFKPIVLAAALEEGMELSTRYSAPAHMDIEVTGGTWEVENYGGTEGGVVDLVDATVNSYNTAYAQLVMDVGAADAVRVAAGIGIDSPLMAVPSAVLGANDVSPLDMASAYSSFANRGVHNDPVFVTRVLGPDGEVIYQHAPSPLRVLERETADQVTQVLQQVISRGTGVRARIGRPAAGKTGTGQNWADAWFVGYTPELVTSVWVGFAEGQVPMVPPTTRIRVTGGTWPAEVWQMFMTSALAETPASDFELGDPIEDEPSADDSAGDSQDRVDAGDDAAAADEVVAPGELVSDVVGMRSDLASDILTRAGFVVSTESVPDDQYPPGVVASMKPSGESIVPSGSEVVLYVANGQKVRRVPDVLGEGVEAATAMVLGAGYEVEIVVEAEDNPEAAEIRAGQVWKVDPGTHSPLEPGQTVTIWANPAL